MGRWSVSEYLRGYIDGLTAYAWWKDGIQYVGTTGRTLSEAIAKAPVTFNYNPNPVDETKGTGNLP